jgi:lactoylglutathione lyase
VKKEVFPILYARDLPRLVRFYRDLIGMAESFRFPDEGGPAYVTLAWGGGSLGVGTYEVTSGLEARDLRQPREGRGFEPWGERVAYVRDPEGNTVMLTCEIDAPG